MATRRRVVRWASAAVAVAAAVATPRAAAGPAVSLRAPVRVTTSGETACPAESEPEVAVTSAGTWVAYNDDHECAVDPTWTRTVSVQLLPAGGGAARRVEVAGRPGTTYAAAILAGDPDLSPDADGRGVVFTTLVSETDGMVPILTNRTIDVYRVSASLKVTRLPSPTVHTAGRAHDDKVFSAVDAGPRSRYRGRIYVVWGDTEENRLLLRAWDGRRWLPAVTLSKTGRFADVAVSPTGEVAAGWQTGAGVVVATSRDGGRSFTPGQVVMKGSDPGRHDWLCGPVVGVRQRVHRSVRVAYDRRGRLHAVAALGDAKADGPLADDAAIWHAERGASGRWTAAPVTREVTRQQWAPAVAATPRGGVAVSWLEVADPEGTTYDAFLAVLAPGRRFGSALRLSPETGALTMAKETMANTPCYGLGDYTGLAPSPSGVVAVWPTTEGAGQFVDSDIYAREAVIR